jgi:hypothetical protein
MGGSFLFFLIFFVFLILLFSYWLFCCVFDQVLSSCCLDGLLIVQGPTG